VRQLFSQALQAAAAAALADKGAHIAWGDEVLGFLLAKVEFDGAYPLEGAKPVERVMTRHLDRLIRRLPAAAKGGGGAEGPRYRLGVAGAELALELVGAAGAGAAAA
jgi:hypothetical protein